MKMGGEEKGRIRRHREESRTGEAGVIYITPRSHETNFETFKEREGDGIDGGYHNRLRSSCHGHCTSISYKTFFVRSCILF